MRIYAEPDDLTLSEMEQAAIEKGITKKQLLLEAIDLYLIKLDPMPIRDGKRTIR